jgi:catechol 2,3-dioxygenase-like lactoylglutathione lyase family enzyme
MTKLRCVTLFASDMGRSVAFYRDVLGWPLQCQSPARTELATARWRKSARWSSRWGGH